MEFDPYNVASYDYDDANKNGFAGYELEKGDYTLFVAHDALQGREGDYLYISRGYPL
ncbi:MAG: hypothetical protein ACLTER_15010 [Ruminococcus sp.]